jgi:electron transfer flavoprotein beta subunit
MRVIVCIKSVVRSAPGGVARRSHENCELNPFDRPALEAALQLKADHGAEVVVVSMGPAVAGAALAESRAMGADRAALINDRALAGSDTLVTASVLAAAARRLAPFDFILFGVRTMDSDTGQVGPQTAALLDLPFVSGVKTIEPGDAGWRIRRAMDDWEETWDLVAPGALTIHARAFAPRPISLTGIGRTYEATPAESWNLRDLNLAVEQVGLGGSPTRVAKLQVVERCRRCRMLTGEPGAQVEALVDHLSERGLLA